MQPLQLLTIEEIAEELRTSRSTVYFWIHTGKLRSIKPGRRRLVHRHDLEFFMRSGGKKPGKVPIPPRKKSTKAKNAKKKR